MPKVVSSLVLGPVKLGPSALLHVYSVPMRCLCHIRPQHQMWPLALGLPCLSNCEMDRLKCLKRI